MEKKVMQAYLFDFYGELLNEHQRSIYEDFVCNDLSLAEIAEAQGISRQGVHDLVKRCDKLLFDYEEKQHLFERFRKIKDKVEAIHRLTDGQEQETEGLRSRIRQLSSEILEEL
mgnify:CR=1 FL=1